MWMCAALRLSTETKSMLHSLRGNIKNNIMLLLLLLLKKTWPYNVVYNRIFNISHHFHLFHLKCFACMRVRAISGCDHAGNDYCQQINVHIYLCVCACVTCRQGIYRYYNSQSNYVLYWLIKTWIEYFVISARV